MDMNQHYQTVIETNKTDILLLKSTMKSMQKEIDALRDETQNYQDNFAREIESVENNLSTNIEAIKKSLDKLNSNIAKIVYVSTGALAMYTAIEFGFLTGLKLLLFGA